MTEKTANVQPKDIAEALLGTIKWEENETKGYCTCPGEHLHSEKTGDRECVVYLNGIPTIFCLHQSCIDEVRQANQALRDAIADGEPVDPDKKVSSKELQRRRKEAQRVNQLERRARFSLRKILHDHRWTYEQIQKDTADAPACGTAAQPGCSHQEYDCECHHEARQLLRGANSCGAYLGRLLKYPDTRVTQRKLSGQTHWKITSPDGEEEPGVVV